jgi:type IV pilus assembly protein PilV
MINRGISMIEVLVALAIVAIGMLGLLGLQARALGVQADAFHIGQAADLAAQFAERMRGNHLAFVAGHYSLRFDAADPAPDPAPACVPPCSSAQVAARDLVEWQAELRRRLPGAAGYVLPDAGSRRGVEISLAWPQPRFSGSDDVCDALASAALAVPAGYRCYRTRVFP